MTGNTPSQELNALQQLRLELSQPVVIPRQFQQFLRTVFNNAIIMNHGANETHTVVPAPRQRAPAKPKLRGFGWLRRKQKAATRAARQVRPIAPESMTGYMTGNVGRIYELYNAVHTNNPRVEADAARAIILDIFYALEDNHGIMVDESFLQYSPQVSFRNLAVRAYTAHINIPDDELTDFYVFRVNPRAQVTYRVYLNAKVNRIFDVLTLLSEYITLGPMHISSFKVSGPYAMTDRADNIVIYCEDASAAQKIGMYLHTFGPDLFHDDTPNLTDKLAPGIATGAEPKDHVATGFGGLLPVDRTHPARNLKEHTQKSFGSLRSQAIAAAVVNFSANKDVLGNTFDIFLKFVQIAFESFGIDPYDPSRNDIEV